MKDSVPQPTDLEVGSTTSLASLVMLVPGCDTPFHSPDMPSATMAFLQRPCPLNVSCSPRQPGQWAPLLSVVGLWLWEGITWLRRQMFVMGHSHTLKKPTSISAFAFGGVAPKVVSRKPGCRPRDPAIGSSVWRMESLQPRMGIFFA